MTLTTTPCRELVKYGSPFLPLRPFWRWISRAGVLPALWLSWASKLIPLGFRILYTLCMRVVRNTLGKEEEDRAEKDFYCIAEQSNPDVFTVSKARELS